MIAFFGNASLFAVTFIVAVDRVGSNTVLAVHIEAIQNGANDFVIKPFDASRVLEAVKKVIG